MIFLNDKDAEGKVVVDEEYLKKLEDSLFFLQCLERNGVDNWDGYDDAVDMYEEG